MSLRLHNVPGLAALGILIPSLLTFYIAGWYLYMAGRDLAEREMNSKLTAVGQTADISLSQSLLIANSSPETLFNIFATLRQPMGANALSEYPGYHPEIVRTILNRIRTRNHLASITLLDQNQIVLIDIDGGFTEDQPAVLPDALFARLAFSGDQAEPAPYYRYDGERYKRVYVPIHNRDRTPVAILLLTPEVSYFAPLVQMQTWLVIAAVIGTSFISALTFAVYRLLIAAARSERAMTEADRLQSLGAMAAGVAHEIRNPLGIIRAIAEELSDEIGGEGEAKEMLFDIVGEVQRLNGLVSQFLSFARSDAPDDGADSFDLGALIADTAHFVQKGTKSESVAYHIEQPTVPIRINMDEKSIRQVLLNLLINAQEALEGGANSRPAAITVTLDNVGELARIRISDTGPGINPAEMKHVFDPFFTTKVSGTGLGLSISRTIVERYGGTLTIKSEPERGATVTLLLPAGDPVRK